MENLLFSPYQLGNIQLKNRIVMAPLTRSRSPGNSPGEIVVQYYKQRSEAGLIITEGTSPSANGLGYARIPGLYSADHVQAWKKVTDAVHAQGAKIFIQLMHTGRVAHLLNMPQGTKVLGPSAIAMTGTTWTDQQQLQPYSPPQEMTEKDIEDTIQEYVKSAELAIQAGFDGVEIHGANGYLIDQFLNTASNHRTDRWGGSIQNRIRFAVEIASHMVAKIGADRVGIRVSPYGAFNDMVTDPNIEDTFTALAIEMNKLNLMYMHIVDHSSMGAPEVKPSIKKKIREAFSRTLILSGGYDRDRAEADLQAKKCDLVAFGRPFISNPRLVSKLKQNKPLTPADANTFYTPGPVGYIDYSEEV